MWGNICMCLCICILYTSVVGGFILLIHIIAINIWIYIKISFSIPSNLQTILFRIDSPKNGQPSMGQVVNPTPQTPRWQPVTTSETPLQDILIGNINTIQRIFIATRSILYYQRRSEDTNMPERCEIADTSLQYSQCVHGGDAWCTNTC